MKLQDSLLFIFLVVFIVSLTLGSTIIVSKIENYQAQITGKAATGRIEFTVQAVCGNDICQATAENCYTCSSDCAIPSGNVCCSGENKTGNCCSDSDCSSGTCTNNQCATSSTSSGDGGGGSSGSSGGDSEEPSPISIIESIPPEYIETMLSNGEEVIKLINRMEADKEITIATEHPFLSTQSIKVVTEDTKTDLEVVIRELHTEEVYNHISNIQAQVDSSGGNLKAVEDSTGLTTEEISSLTKVKDKINSAAYKFIKITMNSNGEEVKIKDAKIKFSVEKDWLKQHNILEEEIRLARIRNGGWSYLETRKLGDSYNKIYYEAVTVEFSLFVITYEKPASEAATAKTGETPLRVGIPLGLASSYIGLIIAILITLGLLYYQFFKLNKEVKRKLGKSSIKHHKKLRKEDEKREFIKGILKEVLKQKKK